jgi:hypothetical protein
MFPLKRKAAEPEEATKKAKPSIPALDSLSALPDKTDYFDPECFEFAPPLNREEKEDSLDAPDRIESVSEQDDYSETEPVYAQEDPFDEEPDDEEPDDEVLDEDDDLEELDMLSGRVPADVMAIKEDLVVEVLHDHFAKSLPSLRQQCPHDYRAVVTTHTVTWVDQNNHLIPIEEWLSSHKSTEGAKLIQSSPRRLFRCCKEPSCPHFVCFCQSQQCAFTHVKDLQPHAVLGPFPIVETHHPSRK